MSRIRGRIVAIARAQSPIHHGGDTVGNVQQFRRHQVRHGGESWPVPYVSGNSQKSANRRAAAWFSLAALGLDEEANLSRKEIQLLLSGGAMTGAGQSTRLDDARAAEEVVPALGLHGYAAGNAMQESQVRTDFFELYCKETAHKYVDEIAEYAPHLDNAGEEYASEYLATYWGTRHEPTRNREVRELMPTEEREELEAKISDASEDKGKGDEKSSQMIYEFECLQPGAVLVGGYTFANGIKKRELQAFRSAFTWASEGRGPNGGLLLRMGGKSAVGFGKVEVTLHGMLADGIEPMEYHDTDDLCPNVAEGEEYDDDLQDYIQYLGSREDVRDKLKELA